MVQTNTMNVELRNRAGKGAARATRRAGRVPAVIYGNKLDPIMISLDPVELMIQIRGPGFFSRVYELDAAGNKNRVLPRDLQLDPVTDQPLHVDFMRFSSKTRLKVEVTVVFENEEECPGLRVGGTRKDKVPPTPSNSRDRRCANAPPGKDTVMNVRMHSWKSVSSGRKLTQRLVVV